MNTKPPIRSGSIFSDEAFGYKNVLPGQLFRILRIFGCQGTRQYRCSRAQGQTHFMAGFDSGHLVR